MAQTLTLNLGLVALLAVTSLVRWRQIRGTTLVAPWIWGALSILTLALTESSIALGWATEPRWQASLRYVAAMSTFCPIIALLGAKRPQDRGWQWIVLSLWPILSQPGIEWLLFGGVTEIHPARFWFMMILVAVGATNGLGTRNWPASLLFAAGQAVLLWPLSAGSTLLTPETAMLLGSLGLVGWSVYVTASARFARPVVGHRLDRAWRDFRDEFGVVWALRIRERMTTSATMYDWPVTLAWHGFEPRASATYDAAPQVVEDSFRTLLRRFVSPAWIDERIALGQDRAADRVPVTASTE